MKTIKLPKPRAKYLNDILMSKRNERHEDSYKPSRKKQKESLHNHIKRDWDHL